MKRTGRKIDNRRNLVDYVGNSYFGASNALRGDDRVVVYVEGFDDVAFWRRVFDKVENKCRDAQGQLKGRKFKIMTPVRNDLAKGKKVVLSFSDRAGENLLLCVDSDFDYLFGNTTEQAARVNSCPYLIQTYSYAIENLYCDPRTLHSVAVRVTNSDEMIFDFEEFFKHYSETIYPVFLWYYWSAASNRVDIFPLSEFREVVRVNFLEIADNGAKTIDWLKRKVGKVLDRLEEGYEMFSSGVVQTAEHLKHLGARVDNIHFYMQGHALEDEVVKPMLERVCEVMRREAVSVIENSWAKTISKRNQISGYTNALSDIDIVLRENVGYMEFEFYDRIEKRIEEVLDVVSRRS